MIQIECGITGCPYGGMIEDVSDSPEEDETSDPLEEHFYLREYLKDSGWVPIDVGIIEQVQEVWICPVCQGLLDRAKESQEG